MAKFVQFFVLVAFVIATSSGATIFSKCPNLPVVQDFDAAAYLGKWYEYAKYPYIFEAFGKCITATYGILDNGNVTVFNAQISTIDEKPSDISGTARLESSGKLTVALPVFADIIAEAPYWVLGTDYKSWAVVWSCQKTLGFLDTRVAWILTRERYPNQKTLEAAEAVFKKNKLSIDDLVITDQLACPKNH